MNRTLATVHHHGGVKGSVESVELDLVIADERITADCIGFEMRGNIVPIDTRTANGG